MSASSHITLLYGNQQLKIDETAAALISGVLAGQDPELCFHRFDVVDLLKDNANESSVAKVDSFRLNCETLPFLADRKVIRLDHLEKLKQIKRNAARGKQVESQATPNHAQTDDSASSRLYQAILKYLTSPPEYCFFILTAEGSREQDISSPLLKAVKSHGTIQKFVAYDDDKPIAWVIERGKQKKLGLSPNNAQLLLELLGNDLNGLDQELEKLSLLFPQDHILNETDIISHVQSFKYFSIFRIIQSLSQKDLIGALETLDQILLESSSEHIKLFVLMSQQFVKLLNIHYLLAQKADQKVILSKLKLHPFLGKRLIQQAHTFTCNELEKIVVRLADFDLQFKFNSKNTRSLFQDLFQEICTHRFRSSKSHF